MQLNSNDLYLLSQCAISAALQAGQVITHFPRETLTINKKEAGISLASQVVTEVDHLCQAVILQNLQASCEIFDLALLSEESPDDLQRLEKDFFWCIDPLDGTLPFIEGKHGYAVSIALVSREGMPYIGVIYDPVKNMLYHAVKGAGAFRNGEPWLLSENKQINPSLHFISDRSFTKHPHYQEVLLQLKQIAKQFNYRDVEIIQQGGAAMNACWVLENSPACYFKFPIAHAGGGGLWDFSASTCIFNEMGAVVSDIFGQALDLNRADSTFMNHRGVLYSTDDALAKQIMDLYDTINHR